MEHVLKWVDNSLILREEGRRCFEELCRLGFEKATRGFGVGPVEIALSEWKYWIFNLWWRFSTSSTSRSLIRVPCGHTSLLWASTWNLRYPSISRSTSSLPSSRTASWELSLGSRSSFMRRICPYQNSFRSFIRSTYGTHRVSGLSYDCIGNSIVDCLMCASPPKKKKTCIRRIQCIMHPGG